MIQRILASLAIAFLLMAHPCVDLVEAQSSVRYHSTIALAPLVGALMLDLLILTALFFFAMFVARKLGIWPWVRLALAAWLPLLLVSSIPGSRSFCLCWAWSGSISCGVGRSRCSSSS
jgi:hypothetical protein